MDWVNQYIGIPWLEHGRTVDGCDCYGLVRLVLSRHFNIHLDAHDQFYESVKQDKHSIASVIQEQLQLNWHKLNDEPVQAGDLVLLKITQPPHHVGVMIDKKNFLNVRQKCLAVVESLDDFIWQHRLIGIYRHG
jgi:cell wall-associated NlpC family hydrolase